MLPCIWSVLIYVCVLFPDWENTNFYSFRLGNNGEFLLFKCKISLSDHLWPSANTGWLAVVLLKLSKSSCVLFFWSYTFHLLQTWNNERIKWDPDQFCGINSISVPREMFWMPDLFIYEMWACNTHRFKLVLMNREIKKKDISSDTKTDFKFEKAKLKSISNNCI